MLPVEAREIRNPMTTRRLTTNHKLEPLPLRPLPSVAETRSRLVSHLSVHLSCNFPIASGSRQKGNLGVRNWRRAAAPFCCPIISSRSRRWCPCPLISFSLQRTKTDPVMTWTWCPRARACSGGRPLTCDRPFVAPFCCVELNRSPATVSGRTVAGGLW